MHPLPPTEQDIHAIIQAVLHESPRMIRRFTTDLAHYVYDVVTTSNRAVVVRSTRPDAAATLVGAIYWSNRLRPPGVPFPQILYADVQAPFPFLLLERLPGTDIGNVYPQLAPQHKRAIVAKVVGAQVLVGSLPRGSGFGYVGSYEAGFPYRTWTEVVLAALARSRARIIHAGVWSSTYVDRVQAQIVRFEQYFAQVQPIAFLDDTTTKNVIVQDGLFSGIVDVDVVCFGEPMWAIGLTHMALLSSSYATDYIDAIVPAGPRAAPIATWDVFLLVLFGARARTADDYRTLFAAAGLTVTDIRPTSTHFSIIEGQRTRA